MKLFLQVIFTELRNDITVVDACENIVALQDVWVGWEAFENFHLVFKELVAGFWLQGWHFDHFDSDFFPWSYVKSLIRLAEISLSE